MMVPLRWTGREMGASLSNDHNGLGPDDRDGFQHRWKPSIQLGQE